MTILEAIEELQKACYHQTGLPGVVRIVLRRHSFLQTLSEARCPPGAISPAELHVLGVPVVLEMAPDQKVWGYAEVGETVGDGATGAVGEAKDEPSK